MKNNKSKPTFLKVNNLNLDNSSNKDRDNKDNNKDNNNRDKALVRTLIYLWIYLISLNKDRDKDNKGNRDKIIIIIRDKDLLLREDHSKIMDRIKIMVLRILRVIEIIIEIIEIIIMEEITLVALIKTKDRETIIEKVISVEGDIISRIKIILTRINKVI